MKNFYASMFISLMCALSAQAAVIQVTSDKSGTELQAAINAASSGDTLKVQAGTYYGNFTMKEGVNVIGGWNATFTDTTSYATILDANANGRVLYQAAPFTTLTVWENLTIQNGKFTSEQTDKAGAGVFLCDKGQVKHCLIQNNLFDVTSGTASGGGVYENGYTTSVLVEDCIIRGNTASHGGGVRICGVIRNSVIENNTTTLNACGGVQLHYGGAMYNCIVRNNTGKDTGGVRCTGTKACVVANCLIAGNEAAGTIGGMSLENGIHYIYNNTIVGNKQASSSNASRCGVRLNVNSDLVFANNIVWGNKVGDDVQADQMEIHATYASDRAAAYFRNNAIVHPTVGSNTIVLDAADPGFVDASASNFRLVYASGLINAGEDDTDRTGALDLDGNARMAGDTVDIGAYEYPYFALTVAAFDHATLILNGDTTLAGKYMRPQAYTAAAVIVAEEGYTIKSVTCDEAVLEEVEGVYTLPALSADMTLTIEVEQITFDLTVAAFEHATLVLDGDTTLAGTYSLPYGHTATAVIVAEEGYQIKSVTCDETVLEEIEGVYTLPAMLADMTLSIEVEASSTDIEQVINDQSPMTNKVLRHGQLIILRDGKEYNAFGQQLYE